MPTPPADDLEAPKAGDLRAEIGRLRVHRYEVGYHAGMNPAKLGMFLNERRPLRADLAKRIQAAIEAAAKRRQSAR